MQDPIAGDRLTVVVDEADAGKRLDAFLASQFADFSRNRLKDLILSGAVAIDGSVVGEPKYRVKPAESITVAAPPPVDAEPEGQDIALTILYEDDDLIVIDKPAGLVVHPAPGNEDGTLVNALIHHCGDSLRGIGGVKRPGIVHRLDKDTSGVMVAAKTEVAHNGLSAQFADHGRTGPLERAYFAFVWGEPQPFRGTIDTRIGRDSANRLKQAVLKAGGRQAITHYKTVERFGTDEWRVSLVRCELETGRTHQIRVHLAHIGHPLIGDTLYGAGYATKVNRLPLELQPLVRAVGRQALHAALLGFAHPITGETLRFEARLPPTMEHLATGLAPFALTPQRKR